MTDSPEQQQRNTQLHEPRMVHMIHQTISNFNFPALQITEVQKMAIEGKRENPAFLSHFHVNPEKLIRRVRR